MADKIVSEAEWSTAWDLNSPGVMSVCRDYTIKDGFIRGMWLEEEIDLYHPAARPELPTEFAKVASGEESDLLDFSQTYGLPDFDCVMGSAPRQDLITAYYLGKDLAFLDAYTPGRGDPIDWVLAHARQVRLVLGLVKRLPDESELEAFLQTLIRDGPKGKKIYFEIIKRNERWPLYWCYSEDTPQGYAYRAIEQILSHNTQGVRLNVMLDRDEKGQVQLIRYFGHYSLLDAIYQHLTDAILGNHIRVCEHCRQPFIAKNNKAKFCRPKRGYGEVSQCLSRAKQANYRRRKKKG